MLLMLSFCFLCRCGDPRYLHSFPTRRSSDLLNKQLQVVEGINGATVIDDTWSITTTSLQAALRVLEKIDSSKKKIAIVGTITDRKSTRLNSSHVKISYAVFCLKKKKRKEVDK